MTTLKGRLHKASIPLQDFVVQCKCGEKVRLYWNGGELDMRHCISCGRYYWMTHVRVDVRMSNVDRAWARKVK